MRIFITAISGTATASLASILIEAGHKVYGSDREFYPPMGDFVKSLPVKLYEGFSPKNIENSLPLDGLIAGNLVSSSNTEIQRAIELGVEILSTPEALYHFIIKNKKRIVVAGTHGKTTTSSLLAWGMEIAEKNPGFLIGGIPNNFGKSGRPGEEWFIVEGDEYETSFFDKGPKFAHLFPHYLILGPVEMDHYDIYETFDAVKKSFSLLVSLVPESGMVISYSSLANKEIIKKAKCPVIFYPSKNLTYENLKISENEVEFDLIIEGKNLGKFSSQLPSSLTALNFLPAAYILWKLGAKEKTIREAFGTFKGVKRRMELLLQRRNLLFFTDFAHHPTSLRANLEDLRKRFRTWNIIAILEPKSWTMRSSLFQKRIPEALSPANHSIITPPPSGPLKKGIPLDRGKICRVISSIGKNALCPNRWDEIYKFIPQLIREKTIIVLFSNGNIREKTEKIKEVLSQI